MRALILIACLALAACQTTDIAALTKHLNERNCATEGSVTIGGLVPASGWAKWDCGGPKPASSDPVER
jgi:hypothetical protein